MAEIYRVNTRWTGVAVGGGVTVMHFQVGVPGGTTTEAQACVDAVRDFWTTLAPRISASGSWVVDGSVDLLNPATGTLTGNRGVTSRSGLGSGSGDFLPLQVQGMVRWDTSVVLDGHRLRGRTYIPGPTEADNGVGGVPIGTYTSGLNTAAATLVGLTTAELQIWHRPIPDGAPGGPRVGAAQTVLSGVALGSWKTQRRRAS